MAKPVSQATPRRELDPEVAAYVEMVTAERIRAGMNPDTARRAVLIEAGGFVGASFGDNLTVVCKNLA